MYLNIYGYRKKKLNLIYILFRQQKLVQLHLTLLFMHFFNHTSSLLYIIFSKECFFSHLIVTSLKMHSYNSLQNLHRKLEATRMFRPRQCFVLLCRELTFLKMQNEFGSIPFVGHPSYAIVTR